MMKRFHRIYTCMRLQHTVGNRDKLILCFRIIFQKLLFSYTFITTQFSHK